MSTLLKRNASQEVLNSQSRKIIYKVLQFYKEEKKKGLLIPLNQAIVRTAKAVGKSERTVQNIAKECEKSLVEGTKIRTPGRRRAHSNKLDELDEFDKSLIHRTYLEFIEQKGEIPTAQKLLGAVKEKINFQATKTTFWRMLKHMGFMFKRWRNMRPLLMERDDIIAQRTTYLRAIRANKSGQRKPVVYTGEATIHSRCIVNKSTKKDASKVQRVIITHAGGEMGFIKGAEWIFCPKYKYNDNHDDMNSAIYIKWLQKQLIPNLLPGCIIVLHNTSYNKVRDCKTPTLTTMKAEVVSWLKRKNVSIEENLTKAELLELVRIHKPEPVYTVDRILQQQGFSVLRLPPFHQDLSPLEVIWNVMKQKLSVKNENCTSSVAIKDILLNAVNNEVYGNEDEGNESMEEDCCSTDSSMDSAEESTEEVIVGYPPCGEV